MLMKRWQLSPLTCPGGLEIRTGPGDDVIGFAPGDNSNVDNSIGSLHIKGGPGFDTLTGTSFMTVSAGGDTDFDNIESLSA